MMTENAVPLDMQRMVHRTHQVDELLVDDADDLLARPQRLQDLLSDRLLGDAFDELLGDLVVDVGSSSAWRTWRRPSRIFVSVNRPRSINDNARECCL